MEVACYSFHKLVDCFHYLLNLIFFLLYWNIFKIYVCYSPREINEKENIQSLQTAASLESKNFKNEH